MKAQRIALAATLVLVLTSGCGGDATSPNGISDGGKGLTKSYALPSAEVVTSTASPELWTASSVPPVQSAIVSVAPMASVGVSDKLAQGAAAAPLQVGVRMYTREMYNNYALTVVYETTKNEDLALLETLDQAGAPLGFQYGRDVCSAVEGGMMNLNMIADNLHANTGLTFGGAEAVVAGAARHLCQNVVIQGYQTYFDSQVTIARTQIHKMTQAWLEPSVVGWAARLTCDFLSFYGSSAGLRPALENFRPYGTQTLALPFPVKDVMGSYTPDFDAVITTVASTWCLIDAELLEATYYHA